MSAEITLGDLEELRKPFPPETVGLLPKPRAKDSQKGRCDECGGWHGLPAVHLDFVGHAAVTDRLLSVDPCWTWEPVGYDAQGLPALDREGNLWIRLTVCGVTRLGVGDGPSMKERIGDALRNAAMRFGVALSLWTKDELESGYKEDKATEDSLPPAASSANGSRVESPKGAGASAPTSRPTPSATESAPASDGAATRRPPPARHDLPPSDEATSGPMTREQIEQLRNQAAAGAKK